MQWKRGKRGMDVAGSWSLWKCKGNAFSRSAVQLLYMLSSPAPFTIHAIAVLFSYSDVLGVFDAKVDNWNFCHRTFLACLPLLPWCSLQGSKMEDFFHQPLSPAGSSRLFLFFLFFLILNFKCRAPVLCWCWSWSLQPLKWSISACLFFSLNCYFFVFQCLVTSILETAPLYSAPSPLPILCAGIIRDSVSLQAKEEQRWDLLQLLREAGSVKRPHRMRAVLYQNEGVDWRKGGGG